MQFHFLPPAPMEGETRIDTGPKPDIVTQQSEAQNRPVTPEGNAEKAQRVLKELETLREKQRQEAEKVVTGALAA